MTKYAALIIIFTAIFAAIFQFKFRIKNIEISNENCIKKDELALYNKSIFLISQKSIEENVKSKFPCAQNLKVEKKLPSTVKLTVERQPAVARIASTVFSISVDGQVILGSDPNLPQFFLPSEATLSATQKSDDPLVLFVLNIIQGLEKSDFHATNVRVISPTEIAVYDAKETVALFTNKKSAVTQVDSLQQVLAKAKIDDDKIAKIDLR